MTVNTQKALKTLHPRSLWLPVITGLVIVVLIFIYDSDVDRGSLEAISGIALGPLLLAFLLLAAKDFSNILRIRFLSGSEFGFGSALYVIFLWEFAIAVAPPVIGGTAVLVFIMFKEGLSFGKALAYTMLAAVLDNLFFLTASPVAIYFSEGRVIPVAGEAQAGWGRSLSYLFYLSYGLIVLYTAFMTSALLFFPQKIRKLLLRLTSVRLFKRWRPAVDVQSNELILASRVLKGKPAGYWLSLVGYTYLIWLLKYAVLNAVMAGFVPLNYSDHLLILGRHLIMWITMLVSPTPGSAGAAEFIFPAFYREFLGEYAFASGLLWRLITYYPYLIIGALLVPKWSGRVFRGHAGQV